MRWIRATDPNKDVWEEQIGVREWIWDRWKQHWVIEFTWEHEQLKCGYNREIECEFSADAAELSRDIEAVQLDNFCKEVMIFMHLYSMQNWWIYLIVN